MSSVVSIVLCGVYCGVHKPIKSSKNTSYLCESQQLNDKLASFWYFQPLSDFSFFLLTQWHLLTFFPLISFFFKEATKITSFFRNWFNFLKTSITLLCLPLLIGSCTDSVPSIHIRLAILTDISWNKFKKHMVSTWKPHGIYIETIQCPPGNHVVTTLCQHGNHMKAMFCPHRNNVIFTWKSYGVHIWNIVVTTWKPHGVHMESTS